MGEGEREREGGSEGGREGGREREREGERERGGGGKEGGSKNADINIYNLYKYLTYHYYNSQAGCVITNQLWLCTNSNSRAFCFKTRELSSADRQKQAFTRISRII